MKAKSSYSQFIAMASARGAMAMIGMIGVFLTGFVVWSILCLSMVLVELVRKSF